MSWVCAMSAACRGTGLQLKALFRVVITGFEPRMYRTHRHSAAPRALDIAMQEPPGFSHSLLPRCWLSRTVDPTSFYRAIEQLHDDTFAVSFRRPGWLVSLSRLPSFPKWLSCTLVISCCMVMACRPCLLAKKGSSIPPPALGHNQYLVDT